MPVSSSREQNLGAMLGETIKKKPTTVLTFFTFFLPFFLCIIASDIPIGRLWTGDQEDVLFQSTAWQRIMQAVKDSLPEWPGFNYEPWHFFIAKCGWLIHVGMFLSRGRGPLQSVYSSAIRGADRPLSNAEEDGATKESAGHVLRCVMWYCWIASLL